MPSFAIIPAAGRSERMGSAKLLLPWQDKTVIEAVIAAWLASRIERAVVVVRPDDHALAEMVRRYDVDLVIPESPPPEMKVSVRLALAHLSAQYAPQNDGAWLLAPADMPRLSIGVIDRLLAERHSGEAEILIPTFAGRRGHPVLFPWPLASQVERLAADEGINALAARHRVRLVPCQEPAILDDLDTPADYLRLQNP